MATNNQYLAQLVDANTSGVPNDKFATPYTTSELTDLQLSGAVAGNTIQWNGMQWVPAAAASFDGAAYALPAYIDASVSSVIATADSNFDTLGEIATAIDNNADLKAEMEQLEASGVTHFIGDGLTTEFAFPHYSGNVDAWINGVKLSPFVASSSDQSYSDSYSGGEQFQTQNGNQLHNVTISMPTDTGGVYYFHLLSTEISWLSNLSDGDSLRIYMFHQDGTTAYSTPHVDVVRATSQDSVNGEQMAFSINGTLIGGPDGFANWLQSHKDGMIGLNMKCKFSTGAGSGAAVWDFKSVDHTPVQIIADLTGTNYLTDEMGTQRVSYTNFEPGNSQLTFHFWDSGNAIYYSIPAQNYDNQATAFVSTDGGVNWVGPFIGGGPERHSLPSSDRSQIRFKSSTYNTNYVNNDSGATEWSGLYSQFSSWGGGFGNSVARIFQGIHNSYPTPSTTDITTVGSAANSISLAVAPGSGDILTIRSY